MNNLTVRTITAEVASYYRVPVNEIYSTDRKSEFIKCKHIAMYFIKQYTKLTLSGIGSYFPGRNGRFDHSSVLHAVRSVSNQYDTNRLFKFEIDELMVIFDNMLKQARDLELAEEEVFMQPDFFTI